jgi:mono/diheme cytochrome c family protein
MEYLARWRMLVAGDKLKNSSDPVSVISIALGYESEAAFSTAFKRVMGCAPRQYSRSLSNHKARQFDTIKDDTMLRFAAVALLGMLALRGQTQTQPPATANQALIKRYCVGCHNNSLKTAGVTLQGLDLTKVADNGELLERVLRKVETGQMPPAGLPRPDAATIGGFRDWLEGSLDAETAAHPNPGRPAIHRLNRAEYSNAVRDIFDLDVNAGNMLPVDDSGYGFDNIGDVLSVSPALLDRYLSVARKVSRLAVGDPSIKPVEEAFEPRRSSGRNAPVPARLEWVSDDLPFNSAGGVSVRYYFPLDAEYVLRVTFGDPNNPTAPKPIELRIPIKAGPRNVAVTFPRESVRPELSLIASPNPGRPPAPVQFAVDLRLDGVSIQRGTTSGAAGALPRIDKLSIAGPYNMSGPGDTPSRRKIFVCHSDDAACATKILAQISRRAYRRPVTDADLKPLLAFYQQARAKGGFEYGIQKAVEATLVSPDFLFRVESDPTNSACHPVRGVDLASRLSFFLWSSIPDEELLELGVSGKLSRPEVLRQQVERMLDDPKSEALVSNFAGQWLFIRNLATVSPDPVVFADFDESLRFSMQRETELFFESIVRENRSALDLLTANYTFLNERLAKHYGIPDIYGAQFRRVTLDDPNRGGLLGQASLLTVTSPPNRTSVVQRGKWVLENMLGAPPPPPPADVPSLDATTKGHQSLSLRAALEQHRASPGCAGCHAQMDPIGFALENYNGIGEWRTKDGGSEIDASGKLPDGTKFTGPSGLKKVMTTSKREEFAGTVAEKLLTYALGRGLEYYDQPAVRTILRETSAGDYRMRDLIQAVVMSTPFQMRRSGQ